MCIGRIASTAGIQENRSGGKALRGNITGSALLLLGALLMSSGCASAVGSEPSSETQKTLEAQEEPTVQEQMRLADAPDEVIPADTVGRSIVSLYNGPSLLEPQGADTESVDVVVVFQDGLVIQASTEDSVRPNAIILGDHAGQMAMDPQYSSVETATVVDKFAIVTVGMLPTIWRDSAAPMGEGGLKSGAMVQWADDVWFYNVWIEDSDDTDTVLAIARSMGQ